MNRIVEVMEKMQSLLHQDAFLIDADYRAGVAFSAQITPENLRRCMILCDETGFYLESLTALDFKDGFEIVYHLNCYEPRSRFIVRTFCGHDQTLPTISDVFPIAMWKEREVHDFFGVTFVDHPDLTPLLLPEDADYHPLKKDFGSVQAYRRREEIYG
jgi:NADH-quinone oxidoreductase subunit C